MARASRPFAFATAAPFLLALASFLGGCVSLPVHNINFLVGSRGLDENDWEPVDQQLDFGIEADTYKPHGGIGAELGAHYSFDEGKAQILNEGEADVEGETWEVFAGARKTFPLVNDRLFPYVGMGLSYIHADFDATLSNGSVSDDSATFGVYIRGGAYWNFVGNWHAGLDFRRLIGTEVDILGIESDADYFQAALFFGFAF